MKRPAGRKIKLGDLEKSPDTMLVMYCIADPIAGPGCRHQGKMPLLDAVELFGPDTRLDDIPFVCSACGRRQIDVRAFTPYSTGKGLIDYFEMGRRAAAEREAKTAHDLAVETHQERCPACGEIFDPRSFEAVLDHEQRCFSG